MDPQSSQRIQAICIRSCCRNPKQFGSLSVETRAWGVQRSWWRLSGYTVERLTDRWKHGPEFLGLPEDDWPNDEFTADQSKVEKEGHKPQLVMKLTNQPELIDCKTFSNWRLVRVSAYVLRFISNLPIYAIGKEQDRRKFQRSKRWTAHAPRTSGNRDLLGQEEVLDPQSPRFSQNCKVPMCTLPRNGTQGWKLSLWPIYQEAA